MHVNLPFQAGDDDVLDRMRRGYTNDGYRRLVEKIRARVPSVSLSTDLIVGFCGEGDSQFQETLSLLRDVRFDKVHAAAYSTREGTIASRTLEDDVSQEAKRERLKAVEELQEQIATEINAEMLGHTTQVLVEGRKRGKWYGRNRNDKLVFFSDDEDLKGELVAVQVEKTGPWSLQGTLVP